MNTLFYDVSGVEAVEVVSICLFKNLIEMMSYRFKQNYDQMRMGRGGDTKLRAFVFRNELKVGGVGCCAQFYLLKFKGFLIKLKLDHF